MTITVLSCVLGFILDLIIGDPHCLPHPIRFIGWLIRKTEILYRKLFSKTKKEEYIAGIFLWITVVIISTIIPFIILFVAKKINIWIYIVIESIMFWQILAIKSLKTESMYVYEELKKGDLEKARYKLSMIVGRDTENLNEEKVSAAAVETVAENFSDGVIAPMMFTFLLGCVGGFFVKAVNTMDSMVGYKNDKYMYFGRFAAKADDVINYIPSRVSALLMIAASIFCGYDSKNAYKIWKRDKRKHTSPNSAHTEAVCAGALGLQLAGDTYYRGILCKKDFIGDKKKITEYEDIEKVNKLMYFSSYMAFILFLFVRFVLIYI